MGSAVPAAVKWSEAEALDESKQLFEKAQISEASEKIAELESAQAEARSAQEAAQAAQTAHCGCWRSRGCAGGA